MISPLRPLQPSSVGGAPVVVVRGAAVVRLAVRQRAADADEEQRAVFPGGRLLPLFRREPGELPQQLGLDERDALGQDRGDVREELVNLLLDGLHRVVDLFDDLLEEAEVALLGTDRALPVPLVHVERMGVVQLLVGADGVHVGVQPVSGGRFCRRRASCASTWRASAPLRPAGRPGRGRETTRRAPRRSGRR